MAAVQWPGRCPASRRKGCLSVIGKAVAIGAAAQKPTVTERPDLENPQQVETVSESCCILASIPPPPPFFLLLLLLLTPALRAATLLFARGPGEVLPQTLGEHLFVCFSC